MNSVLGKPAFSLVAWLGAVPRLVARPRERATDAAPLPFSRLAPFSRRSRLFRSVVIVDVSGQGMAAALLRSSDLTILCVRRNGTSGA